MKKVKTQTGETRPRKYKCVRVRSLNNLGAALSMAVTVSVLAIQVAAIIALYITAAVLSRAFLFACSTLTAFTALYILVSEKDAAVKTGWVILMLVSCGLGFFIYALANVTVCYGGNKKRFNALYARSAKYTSSNADLPDGAVKNDCTYLYNAGGFVPRTGTDIEYFSSMQSMFEDMLDSMRRAEKFVFIEFFILADGALLNKFIEVIKELTSRGVEVRILCDGAGSLGVLSKESKKAIQDAGARLKIFAPLKTFFNFGLNFRDHRKIVVIDGKTSYVCGCNIADECINTKREKEQWKDAGVKLEGCAVDDNTLIFLRQWDYANKTDTDWDKYLGHYERTENNSVVVPFAGGPDVDEAICRGAYLSVISGAREKLFIMTPYFVPDGEFVSRLKEKALSGVDVRLVLPAVPDWKFLYRVTVSNAESLIKSGVKVYYLQGTFSHGKVMLTENCAVVGSVNTDMRAFYQEFDNAVYTNDIGAMREIQADFNSVFSVTEPAVKTRHNIFDKAVTAILKLFSPLM